MNRFTKATILAAAILTVVAIITWRATGGDYYTKFEIIEQVEKEIAADDPLAAAGFYEGDTRIETVRRDGFRMGLLPTPAGIIDKHAISVASISIPSWTAAFILIWINRRRQRIYLQGAEQLSVGGRQ